MTRASIGGSLQEDLQDATLAGNFEVNGNSALQISSLQRGLLGGESHHVKKHRMLTSIANIYKLQRFIPLPNLASPSAEFRQKAEERDELSHSVPSSIRGNFRKNFNGFLAKIDWPSLLSICKKWIKDPLNMALLLWIICVAVSGAILFLVMTGMLNKILTKQSQRNSWFEVNNQFLNALFTLMCLYQHPKRFHHLVLLCRWKPMDITILRKIYCKNGTCKPRERVHMMVVVVLLHVNCIAQYALCGLNWGFNRSERPAVGVGICISIAIAAPALAGVYCIASPLGKEYYTEEEEAQNHVPTSTAFASINDHSLVEYTPQWQGGLCDLRDNVSVAYLSLFCSFCVFGRNMERLHFGNMYVHIATFFLFCAAPFWIFNLATFNIDNEPVRRALGMIGILLCVFGLLYGGYWRIQMRKRFKLPPNKLCCGKPAVTDCMQWLFCCWCSLAQEVRTAEFYDIVGDKFFCKIQTESCVQPGLNSLPPEHRAPQVGSMSTTPSLWSSSNLSKIWSKESKDYSSHDWQLSEVQFSKERKQNVMEAPIPLTIQIEDNGSKRT